MPVTTRTWRFFRAPLGSHPESHSTFSWATFGRKTAQAKTAGCRAEASQLKVFPPGARNGSERGAYA